MNELGPTTYDYILQVGTNRRLAYQSTADVTAGGAGAVASTPFPTEGVRRLLYQSRLSQTISKAHAQRPGARCAPLTRAQDLISRRHQPPRVLHAVADYSGLANATITQGLRKFPYNATTSFSLPIASFIGQILYPFGLSRQNAHDALREPGD